MNSKEAYEYLRNKYPKFKMKDFRNHIYLKNIKGIKPKGTGRLQFKQADLDKFSKHLLAKRYQKATVELPRVKVTRSKGKTNPKSALLTIPVAAEKLELVLKAFSEEELQKKMSSVFEDFYTKVASKWSELKRTL